MVIFPWFSWISMVFSRVSIAETHSPSHGLLIAELFGRISVSGLSEMQRSLGV